MVVGVSSILSVGVRVTMLVVMTAVTNVHSKMTNKRGVTFTERTTSIAVTATPKA